MLIFSTNGGELFPSIIDLLVFSGSTDEDQIKPIIKTTIDSTVPLNIKSLGSSQLPPKITNIKIDIDINADNIQKKQNALIFKNIIPNNRILKIDMLHEVINKLHQFTLLKSIFFS